MFSLRCGRGGTTGSRLLVLLALFAVTATACSDLDAALPIDVPDDTSEGATEPPADEEATEPAADEAAEPADEADDAESTDDGAEADDAEDTADDAEGIAPITSADVAAVCADGEARSATAEELAPLVNLTPEAFESIACGAVAP